MRLRAHVQRDAATDGAWGQAGTPDWQTHIAECPCSTWFSSEKAVSDEQVEMAVEDRRMIVPKDRDIKPGDRILTIYEKGTGAILHQGPFDVASVGKKRDHKLIQLSGVER